MIKNIKHVFFDLDHTLWDFDKNSALTFETIFLKYNINVSLLEFLKVYQPINYKYWKLYREEKVKKEKLRYGRLNDTFKALKINVKASIINKLADAYIAHLPDYNYLFDDALLVLDYLKQKYKLHIITNGFKDVQQQKLNQSNISQYFDTVTSSELVGVKKPNAKIFNHALKVAKALPNESVMIGDNLEADIFGALDFGMDAICFNYHNENLAEHIKKIDKLIELKHLL